MTDDVSLCPHCCCMTKTTGYFGVCGKCRRRKAELDGEKVIKIYPREKAGAKKQLLRMFEKEESILGIGVDKDKRFFIIVDADASPFIQERRKGKKV